MQQLRALKCLTFREITLSLHGSRCLVILFVMLFAAVAHAEKPLRVYILAGQSNMEGKAKVSLLEYQATQGGSQRQFAHLRKGNSWIERDDVWIKFIERHGKLTVGYGSPNCIGPELDFGNVVGNHHDQQILIIKTAWGGKSLYQDFRPPSAGLPPEEVLQALLKRAQERRPATTMDDIKKSFGHFYRLMIEDVETTLANLKELFPEYDGQGYELAGFVWFQGWNDMVNADYVAEYTDNLVKFIRDVRKDLKRPELPFVIGQLGVGGENEEKPNRRKDQFKEAQAEAAYQDDLPNVALVKTDAFWDREADAVFKKGWKEHLDEWNQVGSDYPFHYLGSAKTYSKIGAAFGDAILKLEGVHQTTFYDPVEKEIEGWPIKVDPVLLAPENKDTADRAFKALANHLQRVEYIVPKERLAELKKLPIWVELHNPVLGNMQYHPGRGWLLANGHDPRLVKHVHIPRAKNLFDPGMWAKHPYVVLHELAHSYHDQVLSFDHPKVIGAFDEAQEKGIYENVLLYTGQKVRHYALSDHKEYFAESTESYFGVNDFYPFVRAELRDHDRRMFDLMEEIWGPVR